MFKTLGLWSHMEIFDFSPFRISGCIVYDVESGEGTEPTYILYPGSSVSSASNRVSPAVAYWFMTTLKSGPELNYKI